MKNILYVSIALLLVVCLGCQKGEKGMPCKSLDQSQIQSLLTKVKSMPLEDLEAGEVAVLETNFGKMVISFFPEIAPEHSKAFKRLVKSGYYDCTKFHRIIQNFVIQGGDILTRDDNPDNDGTGGPGYTLPAEFSDTPHDKGILSMARRGGDNDSAGSQFFICLSRQGTQALDGQYTVFGKLVEGLDVMEKIANVQVKMSRSGERSQPAEPVFIEKAYMEVR